MKPTPLLISILKENSFSVKKYITHSDRSDVLLAERNGVVYFLKISTHLNTRDTVHTEYAANIFIRNIQPLTVPLYIPRTQIIEKEAYTILVCEYIPGHPLANHRTFAHRHITRGILETLYQISSFYLHIPLNSVPHLLKHRKPAPTIAYYQEQIEQRAKISGTSILTSREITRLQSIIDSYKITRAFQHHDFVLWNMLLSQGNTIALVDAEFSRSTMRYYDIAYFFLQTYTCLTDVSFAQKSLAYFIRRFEEEYPREHIRSEILLPLTIRVVSNVSEALGHRKRERLVRELLQKILTADIDEILS